MSYQLILKHFNELNTYELYAILSLREEVFMIEQKCSLAETDGIDLDCYHFMIKDGDHLAAYSRLISPGVSYKKASIGRVVVAPKYRGKSLGKTLMIESINRSEVLFKSPDLCISAQTYLIPFYESLGFKTVSEVYSEAGIPHVKMEK